MLDTAGATELRIPPPTDPDGDAMTGLPRSGGVSAAGQPLLIGDVISLPPRRPTSRRRLRGRCRQLPFFDQGQPRRDHLRPLAHPGRGIEPATGGERPSGAAPALIPLKIQPPVDPEGDPLTITVTEVPGTGAIKHGDEVLSVGDELTPEGLAGLILEPAPEGCVRHVRVRRDGPGRCERHLFDADRRPSQ